MKTFFKNLLVHLSKCTKKVTKVSKDIAFEGINEYKSDSFKKILSNYRGKIKLILPGKLKCLDSKSVKFIPGFMKSIEKSLCENEKHALETLTRMLVEKYRFTDDEDWNIVVYIKNDDFYYIGNRYEKDNWKYDAGLLSEIIYKDRIRVFSITEKKT